MFYLRNAPQILAGRLAHYFAMSIKKREIFSLFSFRFFFFKEFFSYAWKHEWNFLSKANGPLRDQWQAWDEDICVLELFSYVNSFLS